MFEESLKEFFEESAKVKLAFFELNKNLLSKSIEIIINAFKNGNKLLICGNGGSAADAQHFAAEMIGRFKFERDSFPAIALTTDTSILTAISNDYGFEEIFKKQISALGNKNDILIVISTSGNSKNLIKAVDEAKKREMKIIALLGKDGGLLKEKVDIALIVPSDNTPRIQECHETIIHVISEVIERGLKK